MIGSGEIVIDANIFAHSNNPENIRFDSASEFVASLVDTEIILCLDDTGKSAPDQWTSNLFREYMECVPPTSLAHSVIIHLLQNMRVCFYRRPRRETWTKCKKFLPANNHDAIVLGIAVQTEENLLITNDFLDFPKVVRKNLQKALGVVVMSSDEL